MSIYAQTRPPLLTGPRPSRATLLRQLLNRRGIFILIVTVPTVLACLYYGLIASKRYASEAVFVVRSISGHRASGLEMLFQSFGVSRTVDDGNAVQSYLLSRDAVRALEQKIPLRAMFSRDNVDLFARFPHFWRTDSFERLYDYYLERVDVVQNSSKGLAELTVIAFRPDDAQAIAKGLLTLAEEMVNRLNERAQGDAVKSAQAQLRDAETRAVDLQRQLTAYRNRERLVDPTSNSASILETITALSTDLATAMTQLDQLRVSSPSSPSINALVSQVDSLKRAIALQRNQMAGGDAALASKISEYERLALEQKIAETSLTSAAASLENARLEARRQTIYLEEVVLPNAPDESNEPQRLRMVATAFVLSLLLASVVWLVLAGAKEHVIE
jgi:capsular polysaccharide transport system permease protein